MNNELTKSSANSKAFANKSVNGVLISFGISRENIALVGDTLIDESLTVPRKYCTRESHETCIHATVVYDESFHMDDQVRKLKFTDSLSIPDPDTCYAGWKMLGKKIETRKPNEKAAFIMKWGNFTFNVVELNTLKDLGLELLRTKRDTKEEEYFLLNGKNQLVPKGIIQLNEEDHDISIAIKKILKNNLTLQQNIPLNTIDRTMEHFDPLDNEQLYNYSLPSRQLMEDDLHIVAEICNTESKGMDVYLVFTPEMNNKQFCEDYAVRKGCNSADNIHIILNVSLAKQLVNLTDQNGHWVYAAIKSEKEVVYGDPLGSQKVPTNLFKVLNPIYRARYGKNMVYRDVKIKNCSKNINFPVQTCSTICGLVSAMLCVFSFCTDLYNEIMFSRTENSKLEFIKHPSSFSDQIRMRFLKIVISGKHCVQTFFPSQMTYYYKEGEVDEQPGHTYSTRKSKSIASKAWESLKSKSRSKVIPPSMPSVIPPSVVKPSSPFNNTSVPPSKHSIDPTAKPSVNPTSKPQTVPVSSPSISPSNSNNVMNQLMDPSFMGDKSFKSAKGYPNIDGFLWKIMPGRKVKGPRKFICAETNCGAEKSIYKRRCDVMKQTNRKNPNDPITVKYSQKHECKVIPKMENISVSSYYVKMTTNMKAFDTASNKEVGAISSETIEEVGSMSPEIDDEVGAMSSKTIEEVESLSPEINEELGSMASETNKEVGSMTTEQSTNLVDKSKDSPVPLSEVDFASEIEIDKDLHDESRDSNDNSFITNDINDLDSWPDFDDCDSQEGIDDRQDEPMNINNESCRTERNVMNASTEVLHCYLCNYQTTCQRDYMAHINCSHGKLCPLCEYSTTTEVLLSKHQSENGHFKCWQCDFQAKSELMLNHHIETKHIEIQQANLVVNDLLVNSTTRKRKGKEDYECGKRLRIDASIKESSLDMFESPEHVDRTTSSEMEEQSFEYEDGMETENLQCHETETNSCLSNRQAQNFTNDDKENETNQTHDVDEDSEIEEETIQTITVKEYNNNFDNNEGNVGYIINDFPTNKKPASDRKLINWGTSQSQRGKTTCYPCAGYFKCNECETKVGRDGNCLRCKTSLLHSACSAKKYVYFCQNECVREIYKGCCKEDPNQRKLVVLYAGKHSCITTNVLENNKNDSEYKTVKTKEDIIDNLAISIKSDVVHFSVENLARVPSDIDGHKYIVLENDDNQELREVIRDGRKWQTFIQTTSQSLSNILGEKKSKNVRKYKCSDQYFCFYEECPFKKRFEILNQINWKIEDGKRRCVSCSEEMELIHCTAEKFVVKSENGKFVLIKHNGFHKCLAKTTLETQVLEEMESFFEKNPTATRSQAIVHHLVNKIHFGSKQEVIDLVTISLNIWEINNCKQKGIRKLNPHGNKMEAIRHFKNKLIEIGNPYDIIMRICDDIYICDTCNFISESSSTEDCIKVCADCSMTPMQHVGPSVFISCKESLATLRELTAGKSLETEACCLDHQPSRLRQFTTFAAYSYDLDLRRMSPLFASVMTNERELSVFHTLDVVDRCMRELFQTENTFDPNLIIADEATAIKNAVARKIGKEKMQKQYGTCQLHYKGSVLQHCSYVIGDKKAIWQYMKLSQNLMTAENPIIYELFKKEMIAFISKTEQRHDYLMNWFEFYDCRKTGWSNAFRNPELPQSNKGEAGNAHYSAVTQLTGLTLDLGVKCMIAEFHVYAGCRRGIVNGQYKGGSGPTRVAMDAKLVKETFARIENTPLTSEGAHVFVQNVLHAIGLTDDHESIQLQEKEPLPMKQKSQLQTHKHLAEQIKARADARISSPKFINTPHKAPKTSLKRKIKFTDDLEDLFISKAEPKSGKGLDEKALQTLTDGFTVKVLDSGVYELTINEDEQRRYTVDLRENPTCSCPEFKNILKSRRKERNTQICKHILVMLLCLGFSYGSSIIRKYSYNATDRIILELKIAQFAHKDLDLNKIKLKFENEMKVKETIKETDLPYFDPKKYYGQYHSYKEAKLFIDEQKERYPCKWFGLKYEEKRYQCTSASHTTAVSKKLRQKLSQARPLVFLVHFTRIFLNKNTGKYSAKDEKKYFHMLSECVANLGSDLVKFSNLKPPFDIDITRLPKENRELVKNTFSEYTFVE